MYVGGSGCGGCVGGCVGIYVCACIVCTIMRFVVLRGIELKLGMGVRDGPSRFERSSRGQVTLEMSNGYQIWKDQRVMHCWGQTGSTRVQITQICLMGT